MRKIRDKTIAKLAEAASRSVSKHTPMAEAEIRYATKHYGISLGEARTFKNLSPDTQRFLLGEIQSFREIHGFPAMTSPLVRGQWHTLLKRHS